jgi:hypothetical protein
MPLFFFHFRDQGHLHEDSKGLDLPDLHAALEEALRTSRELAGEFIWGDSLEFEIADSSGCVVLKVPIQERRSKPRVLPGSRAKNVERYLPLGREPKYLH